jgi:hypothetical protein
MNARAARIRGTPATPRCTGGYQPTIAAALDVVRSNSDNVSSDPTI